MHINSMFGWSQDNDDQLMHLLSWACCPVPMISECPMTFKDVKLEVSHAQVRLANYMSVHQSTAFVPNMLVYGLIYI